jgi:hypothetical protein
MLVAGHKPNGSADTPFPGTSIAPHADAETNPAERNIPMATTLRTVARAAFFCLAVASNAAADTILLTSGFITAPRSSPPTGVASVTGTDGFTLNARVTPGEGRVDPITFCNPCAPGDPLSVGASLSGSVFFGSFTLNGILYDDISTINSPASLFFEFFGGGTAPAMQDGPVLFTAPFTMSGMVNLPFPSTGPIASGQGTATVLLTPTFPLPGEPALWLAESVRYDFGERAAAVPEPGTLILVSGGLAAIVRTARRRRRERT